MYYQQSRKFNATMIILGINIIVFLLTNFISARLNIWIHYYFGMVPQLFFQKFFVWQPLTYLFVHENFTHIFFNMFMFLQAGIFLEGVWGTKKFVLFYLLSGYITGVVAGLIYLLSGTNTILIGASGAIMALMVGFGLTFPDSIILLFFFIPMKAKYLPVFFVAVDLILWLLGRSPDVSHLGHLVGVAVGFALMYLLFKNNQIQGIFKKKPKLYRGNSPSMQKKLNKKEQEFFLMQCLYKIKNNIHFSESEIDELNDIAGKLNKNDFTICQEKEFNAEDIKCMRCNKIALCLLREIQLKGLN